MMANKNGYWQGIPGRGICLMGLTIRQMLLTKSVILALLILLVPAFIGLYAAIWQPNDFKPFELFADLSLFLFLQFYVLLYSLIYAAPLLNEEIEKKTMTYLISRPMKRWEVAVFKLIGFIISINILFTTAVFVTYVTFNIPDSFSLFAENLDLMIYVCLIMLLGSLAYGALFSLAGALFKHPLMIGILFAFIWEVFIVNIGGKFPKVTIMYYLRSVFYDKVALGQVLAMTKLETTGFSVFIIIFLTLLFLGLTCFIVSRKDMD